MLATINYRGQSVSGLVGSAELMDDTLYRQSGSYSGLKLQFEGGTYGTVPIPTDSVSGTQERLPRNARFINPPATTYNLSFGIEREGWSTELYLNNIGNETGSVMQIAGHYTPLVSVQRPRTVGLRFSYRYQ